jgi:hypothetical protein
MPHGPCRFLMDGLVTLVTCLLQNRFEIGLSVHMLARRTVMDLEMGIFRSVFVSLGIGFGIGIPMF